MNITRNKLNILLMKIKEKYPSPEYLIDKDGIMYRILMNDEELSRSESFLNDFFELNIEIFGDDSSYITVLFDYFNVIPDGIIKYNYGKKDFSNDTLNLDFKKQSNKTMYKMNSNYTSGNITNSFNSSIDKEAA